MNEESDIRKWDELIPDALGLIFKNLSLLEVLTVVPRVCKPWRKAVMGPYCWQEIDIEEWSKTHKPEIVDRMLQLLISRSGGSARKLSVSGLKSDQSILFIADQEKSRSRDLPTRARGPLTRRVVNRGICSPARERTNEPRTQQQPSQNFSKELSPHGFELAMSGAQSLQTLRLPRSEINDSIIETISEKLPALTSLDLSYCINIGAQALRSIGKNCKSLTTLRRVVHPLEVIHMHSQEDEALAIATTMPRLKHLEIACLLVTTSSVLEILKNCKHLELLDIRGCWYVELDEKLVKGLGKLKVVGERIGSEDCFDYDWPRSP